MERITLDEARAAGLDVAADGDELVVRGPRHAEPLARRVLANKPEIMAELAARRLPAPVPSRTADTTTAASDWRDLFEERAAIHQFEAGYCRDIAEHQAYDFVIEECHRRHPQAYDPSICAGCGEALSGEVLERPEGGRVHHRYACLRAHGERCQARAVAALTALGLPPPAGWA